MTDVPILFAAPMIQALLEGRKTQTRRKAWRDGWPCAATKWQRVCTGDRLWVREQCRTYEPVGGRGQRLARYGADGNLGLLPEQFGTWDSRPRSPIHMPRWASRLTLTVTAARIERLRAISEDDAVAEGCFRVGAALASGMFRDLWGQLHGAGAWRQNPQVVVLTFAVARVNIIDAYGEAAP